jgi:hypothetical protein
VASSEYLNALSVRKHDTPFAKWRGLEQALDRIGPHADYRVYHRILARVHRKSGVILDGFQLPTQAKWAEWCGVSESQFKVSIRRLERHGWLTREAVRRKDGAVAKLPAGQHREGRAWQVRYQPQAGQRY